MDGRHVAKNAVMIKWSVTVGQQISLWKDLVSTCRKAHGDETLFVRLSEQQDIPTIESENISMRNTRVAKPMSVAS